MKLNLSADEVLTTTRSVRKRLDFDRPVERSVVEDCLQIALQAPTGSNFVLLIEDLGDRRIGDQAAPAGRPDTHRRRKRAPHQRRNWT